MEGLSLIDVSAEDDLFLGLASPPALPRPPDREPPRAGFRVGAAEAAADLRPAGGFPAAASRAADPDGETEDQMGPERTESPKQRKAKTGVNLRKSLAWDSAFFTSEGGLLDTEELAIVNSTFRKTQGSRPPGITEESRRSGESTTSTLESESWAMESVETELFDNVRASIQRSLGKPSKVTGGPPASSKPPKATANTSRVAARKAVDRMPQMKIRTPVSTSHGVGRKQRPQVNSKEPTAARVTLPEVGEAKPSSKPPRALPRVGTMRSSTNTSITSAISDKRSSTGGEVKRAAVGKSANTSTGVRPGGVMKSSSVSKSSGFTSAATKIDANTKSAAQNNTNRTAQRIPIRSSSRSDCTKTNPTRLSGNKVPARVHSGHASPSISPNSSIDSMSSVISGASTASTVGKTSHTSEGMNSSSPSLRKSNDHPQTTKLRPSNVTEGQSLGKSVSGDSLSTTAGTTNLGKISKPSGLRRPTPNIGFFGAEKAIDQNSGAQVQVPSTKIQRLLPATPKSKPSSTQIMNTSSSSFDQQESKSSAPPEQSGASKSKAAKVLPSKVAQMEVVPFQVAELKVCTHQTASVVAEPEAEKSVVQSASAQVQLQHLEIQCPLPTRPKIPASSPINQQESKVTSVPHDKIFASTSEAVMVVPLKVAEMEIIASTSEAVKVAEPESCLHETVPVMAEHEAEKSIGQNIGGQLLVQPMKIQLSQPGTTKSELSSTQAMNPAPSTLDQQESRPTEAPHEESSALKGKIEKVPLKIAKAEPFEVSNLKVQETEADKVVEHEVVTATEASKENIPALHQNIQANEDASALSVDLLIQKMSSVSLVPLNVAKPEPFEVSDPKVEETEAVKVVEHEVATTTEASKENVPALHQNIQVNDDASALSVDPLIQKLTSVSLGPAPDMTS